MTDPRDNLRAREETSAEETPKIVRRLRGALGAVVTMYHEMNHNTDTSYKSCPSVPCSGSAQLLAEAYGESIPDDPGGRVNELMRNLVRSGVNQDSAYDTARKIVAAEGDGCSECGWKKPDHHPECVTIVRAELANAGTSAEADKVRWRCSECGTVRYVKKGTVSTYCIECQTRRSESPERRRERERANAEASADSSRESIGWYISDTHARRAIGYLTAAIPALRSVPVPFVASAWAEALEKTLVWNEASPIGPEAGYDPNSAEGGVPVSQVWPFCEPCGSYHAPENTSCVATASDAADENARLHSVLHDLAHTLGLALEVVKNEDGSETFGGVWDYRDDPEGIAFDDPPDAEKRDRVHDEYERHVEARCRLFGQPVQPIGRGLSAVDSSTHDGGRSDA